MRKEEIALKLRDKDALVRIKTVEELGEMRDKQSIRLLINAFCLINQYFDVREKIEEALAKIGSSAVKPLISRFHSKQVGFWIREQILRALGRIGDKGTIDFLLTHLKNDCPDIRRGAAGALSNMAPQGLNPKAIKALIIALGDDLSYVREYAEKALLEVGLPAVGPLTEALQDKSCKVWYKANELMQKIKEKK